MLHHTRSTGAHDCIAYDPFCMWGQHKLNSRLKLVPQRCRQNEMRGIDRMHPAQENASDDSLDPLRGRQNTSLTCTRKLLGTSIHVRRHSKASTQRAATQQANSVLTKNVQQPAPFVLSNSEATNHKQILNEVRSRGNQLLITIVTSLEHSGGVAGAAGLSVDSNLTVARLLLIAAGRRGNHRGWGHRAGRFLPASAAGHVR